MDMRRIVMLCAVAVSFCWAGGVARADETDISYQGRLMDRDEPANGSYAMTFTLWDRAMDGEQVGPTITIETVQVADGLFTVGLDFGQDAFNADRWLEIWVGNTKLAPRQPIMAAPVAQRMRGIDVTREGRLQIASTSQGGTLNVGAQTGAAIEGSSVLGDGVIGQTITPEARAVYGYNGAFAGASTGVMGQVRSPEGRAIMGRNTVGGFAGYFEGKGYFQGKLFVGTTAEVSGYPNQLLTLHKDAAAPGGLAVTTSPGGSPYLVLSDQSVSVVSEVVGPTGLWSFHINSKEIMSSGPAVNYNLGIQTDNPTATLHVDSHDPDQPAMRVRHILGGAPEIATALWAETDASGVSTAIRGDATYGGLAPTTGVVGTSSSVNGVGVLGRAFASIGDGIGVEGVTDARGGSGVFGISLETSGYASAVRGDCASPTGYDFLASGNGVDYGSISSRRWKSNVVTLADALDRVGLLRGVAFDWDAEHGGQHDVGFLAEEVGAVLPEIVQYEENGIDAIGLDYSRISPLLVEAINELRAEKDGQIAGLGAQVESLEAENADLRRRLAAIEAAVGALVRQQAPAGAGR